MSEEANLMDDLAEAWDNFEETGDGESGSEYEDEGDESEVRFACTVRATTPSL